MKFNSQICTTRERSERLLSLGLKKETADCIHFHTKEKGWEILVLEEGDTAKYVEGFEIPAWSLGRLVKDLMPQSIGHLELAVGGDYAGYYKDEYDRMEWEYASEAPNMFDNIISTIDWLIKEGYFNKEHLV